jgi:predicted transglutaminase-like cysteine proteinase
LRRGARVREVTVMMTRFGLSSKLCIAVVATAVALLLGTVLDVDAAKKAVPSFFNSKEIQSKNLKPFKKWTDALKRYSREKASLKSGSCSGGDFNACHYKKWIKFLKKIRKKKKLTQVKLVNAYMNKVKYTRDQRNWGKKDYWATPGQFMAKFGDCEDYAIAKFVSLRLLGFKNSALRVVAVKDLNLKVGHAVLVVVVKGRALLLDNQIKQVVDTKSVKHYRPVFSINAKYWWKHRT